MRPIFIFVAFICKLKCLKSLPVFPWSFHQTRGIRSTKKVPRNKGFRCLHTVLIIKSYLCSLRQLVLFAGGPDSLAEHLIEREAEETESSYPFIPAYPLIRHVSQKNGLWHVRDRSHDSYAWARAQVHAPRHSQNSFARVVWNYNMVMINISLGT